jgi:hypothetical protein
MLLNRAAKGADAQTERKSVRRKRDRASKEGAQTCRPARHAAFLFTPPIAETDKHCSRPTEFSRLIAEETEKWGKVIRVANIKPD